MSGNWGDGIPAGFNPTEPEFQRSGKGVTLLIRTTRVGRQGNISNHLMLEAKWYHVADFPPTTIGPPWPPGSCRQLTAKNQRNLQSRKMTSPSLKSFRLVHISFFVFFFFFCLTQEPIKRPLKTYIRCHGPKFALARNPHETVVVPFGKESARHSNSVASIHMHAPPKAKDRQKKRWWPRGQTSPSTPARLSIGLAPPYGLLLLLASRSRSGRFSVALPGPPEANNGRDTHEACAESNLLSRRKGVICKHRN